MKRYWDMIETPFGIFAAWVDEEGRLLRFSFRAADAAEVDPEAERDSKALEKCAARWRNMRTASARNSNSSLNAEGPDFDKLVWKALQRHSVRPHHLLWRGRQGHRPSQRGAGGRRGQWRQSHRPDRALPSGHRQRRQPYRLRRRTALEAQAVGA